MLWRNDSGVSLGSTFKDQAEDYRMYSENQLIARIRTLFSNVSAAVGIGDDAAVVDLPKGFSTILCSDLLVENTHFRRSTHPPDSVGFKSIAVNVSDIGAMGGMPCYCLLSLAVPSELDPAWIESFFDGFLSACESFEVQLLGGDSSVAEGIFIDVSMIGQVRPGCAVRRQGAKVRDGVYVTGKLGESALGLELLSQGKIKHDAVRRHLYPNPRHQVARRIAPDVNAMIDVSDGFSIDLGHILEESGVSARIEQSAIPCAPDASIRLALQGGEDYELIFTASGLFPDEIEGVPITRVGEVIESRGSDEAYLVTDAGEEILRKTGWQHFR
jgi:thiamine-monophosphate kinase